MRLGMLIVYIGGLYRVDLQRGYLHRIPISMLSMYTLTLEGLEREREAK